jgi:hypothetical protein
MLYVAIAIVISSIIFSVALVSVARMVLEYIPGLFATLAKNGENVEKLLEKVSNSNYAVPQDSARASSGDPQREPSMGPNKPEVEAGPSEENLAHLVSKRTKTAVSFGQED